MADEHEQKLEPPLQQMNRTIAMLEHEKAILKQEVTQMYEEILKYRSALHGYEGTHTRIEHLEQQLAQARADLEAWPAKWAHTIDDYSQLLGETREQNATMRALLERWHELSQTIGTRDYSFNEKDDLQEATRVFLGAAEGPASG